MISTYPVLDPQSLQAAGSRVFAAILQEKLGGRTPSSARSVYRGEAELCFYDGCLIDSSGRFNPMDAAQLSIHWDDVGTTIEGQFSAVRVDMDPPRLEVRTDFLGMGQVYYWTMGGRWLLSNSVELVARTIRSADLDPFGISMALSFGWVPGDHTLHRSVRVLPAAAHWRWEDERIEPIKICDYPVRRFWEMPRISRFDSSAATRLEAKLVDICAELGKQRRVVECPITGGRDSRLLIGLMRKGRVAVQYYTDAFPGSEGDVGIGQLVAQRLDLPYQVFTKDIEDMSEDWSSAVELLVKQNDGMVSLWQVIDVLGLPAPDGPRSIRVWGIGGEIARGNYNHPTWHYGWKTPSFAKRFLGGKLVQRSDLFTPEPAATASKFLDQWMDQKLDEGCPVADIPDVFYATERVRRWAGSNIRKVRPWMDLFAPLCTRPFVEAAFRLSVPLRFSEPIHYQLLRLNPELHRVPFSSEPWRNQNPNLSMPQMIWEKKIRRVRATHPAATAYQEILLERKLQDVREYCLGDRDSDIWHYVRKPQFESLISSDSPRGTRKSQVSLILQILTLFRYEQLLRGIVNERQTL